MKTSTILLVFLVLGTSQVFPQPRIYGGELVIGRQFPGQISVQYIQGHKCGGSIVNENYIVTAAHCVEYSLEDLSVLSGTNSLVNGGIRHNVTEIHVHEGYNVSDSWINDIAVLKVDPPFVFDNNTAAVALPQQGQVTPEGSIGTLVGWGWTEDELPDDLRMVNVQVINYEECNRQFEELNPTVYPEMICSSTEGKKGSGSGDSGGPLYVNRQVVGISSWVTVSAMESFPDVLIRVSAYVDWINSKVRS
ncbi:hypothetical protein J437_LFUL009254 [Ladona fulva]|uniref:Peptidase S1 domain-containing protein n=1 Tax=Ladona fulva TaxID=123851 RepID=A0A8K0KKP4_LADFU|nr:hypothetical protein J437_LFUL009254 [Ladona fulva]